MTQNEKRNFQSITDHEEELKKSKQKLARYLCEKPDRFDLSDCFQTIIEFKMKFKKAVIENQVREEKQQKKFVFQFVILCVFQFVILCVFQFLFLCVFQLVFLCVFSLFFFVNLNLFFFVFFVLLCLNFFLFSVTFSSCFFLILTFFSLFLFL